MPVGSDARRSGASECLERGVFRVIAYAALMTDQYQPFRLDQGGRDPAAATDGVAPLPHDAA